MRLDELLEGVRLTGAGTLEGALVQRAVILSPRSPVHKLQHQREPKLVGESPKSLVFQQVNDLTTKIRRNADDFHPGSLRRRQVAGGSRRTNRPASARCPAPAHGRRSAAPPADKSGESVVYLAERASLFRRRRHVKPASTSTPADFRSSIRGDEQPVVLLYDHPRTHTTRRWVAPQLAGSFFVVCPDLRGHGQSTPLRDVPEHAQPSKRGRTSWPLVTAACG
jgi:hypothetical protein